MADRLFVMLSLQNAHFFSYFVNFLFVILKIYPIFVIITNVMI